MTPEERLQTLKAGDDITLRQGLASSWQRPDGYSHMRVVQVLADAVLAVGSFNDNNPHMQVVYEVKPEAIMWPDPPKALPGRRYRRADGCSGGVFTSGDVAVGLVSGRLAIGRASFDFDPASWELLPED